MKTERNKLLCGMLPAALGDHAMYHDGWIAGTEVFRVPWDRAGPVNQDPFSSRPSG